jgi:hypothetical protein
MPISTCDHDQRRTVARTPGRGVLAYAPRHRRRQVHPGSARGRSAPIMPIRKGGPQCAQASPERLEDPRLLTGQGSFLDLTFPDMLCGGAAQPPRARLHPGHRYGGPATRSWGGRVITADDLEGGRALADRAGDRTQELRPPVRDPRARQSVLPESPWPVSSPRNATWSVLALLRVDYAPLPAVIDPWKRCKRRRCVPELGTNIGLQLLTSDDLDAAFAQAAPVRQRYVQRLAPARWRPAVSWPTTSPGRCADRVGLTAPA